MSDLVPGPLCRWCGLPIHGLDPTYPYCSRDCREVALRVYLEVAGGAARARAEELAGREGALAEATPRSDP